MTTKSRQIRIQHTQHNHSPTDKNTMDHGPRRHTCQMPHGAPNSTPGILLLSGYSTGASPRSQRKRSEEIVTDPQKFRFSIQPSRIATIYTPPAYSRTTFITTTTTNGKNYVNSNNRILSRSTFLPPPALRWTVSTITPYLPHHDSAVPTAQPGHYLLTPIYKPNI